MIVACSFAPECMSSPLKSTVAFICFSHFCFGCILSHLYTFLGVCECVCVCIYSNFLLTELIGPCVVLSDGWQAARPSARRSTHLPPHVCSLAAVVKKNSGLGEGGGRGGMME